MSKFKALDLIDRDINDDLQCEKGIAKEMAQAIHAITKIARANIETRLDCDYRHSSHNLSYLISKEILPILEKIFIALDWPISEPLKFINQYSKPADIRRAEEIIKTMSPSVSVIDQKALSLLYGSLIIFRTRFSKNVSRIRSSDDSPYCRFCYREARQNFDSCEDHAGIGRIDGNRQLKRYQQLKVQLRNLRESESVPNEFVLAKLKSAGLPEWSEKFDDGIWIKQLLKGIRACSQDESNTYSLAKDLTDFSKKYVYTRNHKNWPTALEGTLFRYEVCKLMEYKVPNKQVAKRLDLLWAGATVNEVAEEFNINRAPLYRRMTMWERRVNEMRMAGIVDSVIKIVLGLEALPKK